jgi:hypothetical protein
MTSMIFCYLSQLTNLPELVYFIMVFTTENLSIIMLFILVIFLTIIRSYFIVNNTFVISIFFSIEDENIFKTYVFILSKFSENYKMKNGL